MSGTKTVVIEPWDPVIFRDAKPFALGLPARSLEFAMPSTVMGAVRTRSGLPQGFGPETVKRVLAMSQTGPFLVERGWGDGEKWRVVFPAPADVVAYPVEGEEALEWQPLRPSRDRGGSDLPGGLCPLRGALGKKGAAGVPSYWHWRAMQEWLGHAGGTAWRKTREQVGIGRLPRQKRIHVGIESATQAAEAGVLFVTEGLEFLEGRSRRLGIATRITETMETELRGVGTIGGEGRTAGWSEDGVDWPEAPAGVGGGELVRLLLVTPGAFDGGWAPGWLQAGGIPPGCDGLQLELVGAAVPRAVPVSGWSLEAGKTGPKASRLLAPAGSVYFCRVVKGDARRLWLRSIADREEFQRDGFGIVTVGDWQWQEN